MGVILDSSVIVAFERRRFELDRLIADHPQPAIAAITAAELLVGVHRADSPARRLKREEFLTNLFLRMPIIPFDLAQAHLYAQQFAALTLRGEIIGDRDLQIAVTALNLDFELATLNVHEFKRVTGLNILEVSAYVVT